MLVELSVSLTVALAALTSAHTTPRAGAIPSAATHSSAAAAPTSKVEDAPGAAFGDAALALVDAGYDLRDVQVVESDGHIELAMTFATDRRAFALEVDYAASDEAFVSFRKRRVAAVGERRVYRWQPDLMAALASGTPLRIDDACGHYVLDFGDEQVALAEGDHYVVTGSATGADAGAALATMLRDALAGGGELMDVTESLHDDGAQVLRVLEMVVHGDTEHTVVRAEVTRSGRVVAAQTRATPHAPSLARYRKSGELRQRLGSSGSRAAPSIERIRVTHRGGQLGAVALERSGRTPLTIDMAAYEPVEHDCGC